MTIYSWNMFFGNTKLDRAFSFIRDTDWDIFCLQEVPEHFLGMLRTLPVHIATVAESDRVNKSGRFTLCIVTLSRHPIQSSKPIVLPAMEGRYVPIREALFTMALSAAGMLTKRVGEFRQVLYTDVDAPTGPLRIFNLHLSLLYPSVRAMEFDMAMLEHDPSRPTVVCGDFNVLESLHITPINFFRGGSVNDALLYTRERTHVEKRFFEHELTNPLRGNSTHPISQSQLDHILVSNTFTIKNAEVLKDRMGSDHRPIRVEIS